MPSNCNESIRSCAVYRPPHLRKEFVETKYSLSDNSNNTSSLNNNTSSLNNNIFNYVNNNSKVRKLYLFTSNDNSIYTCFKYYKYE